MRVLVVGGGGREHALCWLIKRDAPDVQLLCAPGNPGTATIATNLPTTATDLEHLERAAREHAVDLVVVGPEAPLASGFADRMTAAGIAVFGPSAAAARIEASKAFAKDVMARARVPTARSDTVRDMAAAHASISGHAEPLVVKASGLAAGKGAVICATRQEALAAAHAMLEAGRFGDAGKEVVIEEFLEGEELSVLALTDGEHVTLLPASQDHKRLGDGDTGPNTGGMGAYAPVAIATPALLDVIREQILAPTLRELAVREATYRGVLYAGLMIRPDGRPAVVEFNCRFGDPEAQAVLPVIGEGLLDAMLRIACGGSASQLDAFLAQRSAVVTVLAAHGYPDTPRKGDQIAMPDDVGEDALIFHAGTARDRVGRLVTGGGRVLNAVGIGSDVSAAAAVSRRVAGQIAFDGKVFRRDIAWRELARAGAA